MTPNHQGNFTEVVVFSQNCEGQVGLSYFGMKGVLGGWDNLDEEKALGEGKNMFGKVTSQVWLEYGEYEGE